MGDYVRGKGHPEGGRSLRVRRNARRRAWKGARTSNLIGFDTHTTLTEGLNLGLYGLSLELVDTRILIGGVPLIPGFDIPRLAGFGLLNIVNSDGVTHLPSFLPLEIV